MPKMKTKRAAAKRFSFTANGKINLPKRGNRHILEKKSRSSKRKNAKSALVHSANMKNVLKTLPNRKDYNN